MVEKRGEALGGFIVFPDARDGVLFSGYFLVMEGPRFVYYASPILHSALHCLQHGRFQGMPPQPQP